jgi:hypothetical protein
MYTSKLYLSMFLCVGPVANKTRYVFFGGNNISNKGCRDK